jgi:hypothetical protein
MSPRSLLPLLLGATLTAGCGGPDDASSEGLGLELRISQAVASDVGSFQVVVLHATPELRCAELQRKCIREQVKPEELIVLQGPDGKKARALRLPAALSGAAQETSVDIPVGLDYLVIIEALSRTSPPRFLGSSCNYLTSVSAARNERLLTVPINLANAVDCNPTIEP